MQLHFALGKALADAAKHREAFGHLLAGNALKRRQTAYDEAAALATFDRIRTMFSAEVMRDKAGLGHPSAVPVFIIGMPRSGTTLVGQILASHSRVFGAGEIGDFTDAVARLGAADKATAGFPTSRGRNCTSSARTIWNGSPPGRPRPCASPTSCRRTLRSPG
jgi:hypothetical protein